MTFLAVPAPFPALGADCVSSLGAASASGLRGHGLRFITRYLGSLTEEEVQVILGAGLLVGVVTYADQWDGPRTVAELKALGVPSGVTVWLDVEELGPTETSDHVISMINVWADVVIAGGWMPGLYVGANCILNSSQIYGLRVVRYWRAMSMVPEPACGFSLVQLPRTITLAGVQVDIDVVSYDYRGRLPVFIGTSVPPSDISTAPELPTT